MYILNPDQYLLPSYRLSPFQTRHIVANNKLPQSDVVDGYLADRFNSQCCFTRNGRTAINIALDVLGVGPRDVVTILTTTGNYYISGCVTKEIEKYCRWSREILPETKVIFVNHEFGYAYDKLEELKQYGLPIIEDCAFSFLTTGENENVGKVGDFVIYSFPKIFPIQIGGLLVVNKNDNYKLTDELDNQSMRYVKNVLSAYIPTLHEISQKRWLNYNYLKEKFGNLGLIEHFATSKGVVPGVFMFQYQEGEELLPKLKEYYYAHGVQCSVFYGKNSFFLPVHQNLELSDLDYFVEIMTAFKVLNNEIFINRFRHKCRD